MPNSYRNLYVKSKSWASNLQFWLVENLVVRFLMQKLEELFLSGCVVWRVEREECLSFYMTWPINHPSGRSSSGHVYMCNETVSWLTGALQQWDSRWEASTHVSSCLLFCRMYFASRSSMQNFISWVWRKFLLFVSCNRYSGLYLEQGLYLSKLWHPVAPFE